MITYQTVMVDVGGEKQENGNEKLWQSKTKVNSSENWLISQEIRCPRGSTTVSYTDDLQLLAVGQENGSIQMYEQGLPINLLYDAEMMQELEPCTAIKIRASAKHGFHKSMLATYLSGQIKLWDTKIGKCLFTMKEKRQIYGLNYHPINSKFVTFGDDFKLYLYDEERRVTERILASSEVVGSKNGHTASVCCAKFHPKNPFEVISTGLDGTIQFWDLRAPYAVRNIPDVVTLGEALDISHDGKTLVVGISNAATGKVKVYDYDSGVEIEEHTFLKTHIYCCKFVSISHIGIGGFIENTFCIGNVRTGEVVGFVSNLPCCVMNFAVKRKITQQRCYAREIAPVAISSSEMILELENIDPVKEVNSSNSQEGNQEIN